MIADAPLQAESTFKRFVEVGRGAWACSRVLGDVCLRSRAVVLLKAGPSAGKTAVIVDIIDHNRVRTRAAQPVPAYLPYTLAFL